MTWQTFGELQEQDPETAAVVAGLCQVAYWAERFAESEDEQ